MYSLLITCGQLWLPSLPIYLVLDALLISNCTFSTNPVAKLLTSLYLLRSQSWKNLCLLSDSQAPLFSLTENLTKSWKLQARVVKRQYQWVCRPSQSIPTRSQSQRIPTWFTVWLVSELTPEYQNRWRESNQTLCQVLFIISRQRTYLRLQLSIPLPSIREATTVARILPKCTPRPYPYLHLSKGIQDTVLSLGMTLSNQLLLTRLVLGKESMWWMTSKNETARADSNWTLHTCNWVMPSKQVTSRRYAHNDLFPVQSITWPHSATAPIPTASYLVERMLEIYVFTVWPEIHNIMDVATWKEEQKFL